MTSYQIGKRRYWRNKRTGEAYREGAISFRKSRRTGGQVGDGWMSKDRHERNKRRNKR